MSLQTHLPRDTVSGATYQGSVNQNEGAVGKISSPKVISGTASRLDVIYIDLYNLAVQNGFKGSVEEFLASIKGEPGKDGYTPIKGVDYFDGEPGKDGVSCTHSWNGTTLTITSASGSSSANLKGATGDRGAKGDKGDKGDNGDTGDTGAAGKDGSDYVLTDADKAEIAASVLASLPVYDGSVTTV